MVSISKRWLGLSRIFKGELNVNQKTTKIHANREASQAPRRS